MVKELKIGLLAAVTIFFMIWGYQFVKGKNIFSNIKTFHAVYDNILQLDVAAPVMINGFQVGAVSKIELNPTNVKTIIVSMEVDGNIAYPKNTRAVLAQGGIVSGKIILLEMDGLCLEGQCAEHNDTLQSEVRGFVESLVGQDNIENYYSSLKSGASAIFDTISSKLQDEESNSPVNQIIWDLQLTMQNIAGITSSLNYLMNNSYKNLDSILVNMNQISGTLADNNEKISNTLSNIEDITGQVKNADIGKTFESTNAAIDTMTRLFSDMKLTVDQASGAFSQMESLLEKMDSGDGSFAKLINDAELYENLEMTSSNLSLLLQDLRLNPRRYLSFSVFGKKSKEYTTPEDDPAYEENEKN